MIPKEMKYNLHYGKVQCSKNKYKKNAFFVFFLLHKNYLHMLLSFFFIYLC